uniref:Uncharacterized protein n=1 Tax=Phaeocystis antarctica TaxID=33657 RepID=A0A7S0EKB8_9EUKA
MRTPPTTTHCRATTPWSATLLHAAAALAAAGISAGVATAADTSVLGIPGSWQMRETRAGNLCEARATFTADAPGALEGVVRVSSPCTDAGTGVWKVVFDGDTPTFGWALDYEKSRVFYSATQVEAALPGGTVKAKGIIRASPRASPNEIRPVGTFDAKALRAY